MTTQHQDFLELYVDRMNGIIGQPSSVLDSIYLEPLPPIVTFDDFEAVSAPANLRGSETWYPGTASVAGFIYSSAQATFDFGTEGRFEFNGGFWGAFGGGGGGGGGPWVDGALPRDGEEMEFQIFFSGATVGVIEFFWWRKGGPIQGGFLGVIGGLGAGVSKGSGKWTKL